MAAEAWRAGAQRPSSAASSGLDSGGGGGGCGGSAPPSVTDRLRRVERWQEGLSDSAAQAQVPSPTYTNATQDVRRQAVWLTTTAEKGRARTGACHGLLRALPEALAAVLPSGGACSTWAPFLVPAHFLQGCFSGNSVNKRAAPAAGLLEVLTPSPWHVIARCATWASTLTCIKWLIALIARSALPTGRGHGPGFAPTWSCAADICCLLTSCQCRAC